MSRSTFLPRRPMPVPLASTAAAATVSSERAEPDAVHRKAAATRSLATGAETTKAPSITDFGAGDATERALELAAETTRSEEVAASALALYTEELC